MRKSVVIGGAGTIGREVVKRLLARGDSVLVLGRNVEAAADTFAVASGLSLRNVDARSAATLEGVVAEFLNGETPSTLVNCAGSVLLKPAHLTSDDDLTQVLDTNLRTAFNLVRIAGKRGGDSTNVVLVSSCAATIGLPNHEAIACAKGAIEGLVRSAAATYAGKGIRVNGVAPGLVPSPLTQSIVSNQAAAQYSLALHPLRRFGTGDDIAAAIFFLSSEEASWITGQVLGVDGGLASLKVKS